MVGKSKQQIFSIIRDRIWRRINGWGEKTLSSAGKEVLIKSVHQSIPTYIMSCFLLPGYLVRSIEMAIRRFWWGSGPKRKLAWLPWSTLCQSKENGGMGFRDLQSFNLALLAKQEWRLVTCPDSLMSHLFQARYYPNSSFLEASLGSRPSATWRSILRARRFLSQGLRVRIGHGYYTEIWGSPWINDDGNFQPITPRPLDSFFPLKVADLIDPYTGAWDRDMISTFFWPVDHDRILATSVGAASVDDRLIWHFERDGRFLVRSCHRVVFNSLVNNAGEGGTSSSGESEFNWKGIWSLPIPPRIRLFWWRGCSHILPHNTELFRRHIANNPLCPHCGREIESCPRDSGVPGYGRYMARKSFPAAKVGAVVFDDANIHHDEEASSSGSVFGGACAWLENLGFAEQRGPRLDRWLPFGYSGMGEEVFTHISGGSGPGN